MKRAIQIKLFGRKFDGWEEDGKRYIDIKQVCEFLGLDYEQERHKLLTDPLLGEHIKPR